VTTTTKPLPPKAIVEQARERTRVRVRNWINARIEDRSEVDLALLRDEAIREFSRDDHFVQRFFEENLTTLVYDIASGVAAQTRVASRFDRWLEHVGENRHVRVLAMRREDLAAAETERRARGRHEIAIADLFAFVRSKLASHEEVVGDHFTAEQLESLLAIFETGGSAAEKETKS